MATSVFTYPLPNPGAILNSIRSAGGPAIQNTPTGSVLYDHCHISWAILTADDKTQSIKITVDHPFYVTEGTIKSHLDPLFQKATPEVKTPAPAPATPTPSTTTLSTPSTPTTTPVITTQSKAPVQLPTPQK
jgi:hypothetical protein